MATFVAEVASAENDVGSNIDIAMSHSGIFFVSFGAACPMFYLTFTVGTADMPGIML